MLLVYNPENEARAECANTRPAMAPPMEGETMFPIIRHRLTHTILVIRALVAYGRCWMRGRGREATAIIVALAESEQQGKR